MRLPTGHLRKRGNVWWCQWKHQGVPYAQSLKTRETAIARAAFGQAMALVRASLVDGTFLDKYGQDGSSTTTIEDGDIRLSNAWRHYCGSVSRPDTSPQTLQQYEYQWNRLLGWLHAHHPGADRVSQVTRGIAQGFASHLSGLVSANTYNKHIQLYRLVFRILLDDIGSESNPWRAVQKKKSNGNGNGNGHGPHGRRAFTNEELRRIFENLSNRIEGRQLVWSDGSDGSQGRVVVERKLGKQDRLAAAEILTICLLGLHTGLRLGDCCVLNWEDVDLARGIISATPMKTSRTSGKRTRIPIHPELAERLSAIRPVNPAGPVCPEKAAQYVQNRTEVDKRFLTLFRQCGIQTSRAKGAAGANATCVVGFHSFRHTWVTRAAEDGVDAITIREVVGWGSPAMERIYTHVSPEHVKSQMDKRTSTAFPAAARQVAVTPAPDIGTMGTDRLKELAERLAEELARRGSAKC